MTPDETRFCETYIAEFGKPRDWSDSSRNAGLSGLSSWLEFAGKCSPDLLEAILKQVSDGMPRKNGYRDKPSLAEVRYAYNRARQRGNADALNATLHRQNCQRCGSCGVLQVIVAGPSPGKAVLVLDPRGVAQRALDREFPLEYVTTSGWPCTCAAGDVIATRWAEQRQWSMNADQFRERAGRWVYDSPGLAQAWINDIRHQWAAVRQRRASRCQSS